MDRRHLRRAPVQPAGAGRPCRIRGEIMRLTGFQGRTAIVTGAAGGIGRAAAAGLLGAGAKVVATDTEAARAGDPVAGAENRVLDVRDGDAGEARVAEIVAAHGPLGLGVHTAGVLAIGPLLDL